MEKETKTCPYCGKQIQNAAKKCRYCGKWLITDDTISESLTNQSNLALIPESPSKNQTNKDSKQVTELPSSNINKTDILDKISIRYNVAKSLTILISLYVLLDLLYLTESQVAMLMAFGGNVVCGLLISLILIRTETPGILRICSILPAFVSTVLYSYCLYIGTELVSAEGLFMFCDYNWSDSSIGDSLPFVPVIRCFFRVNELFVLSVIFSLVFKICLFKNSNCVKINSFIFGCLACVAAFCIYNFYMSQWILLCCINLTFIFQLIYYIFIIKRASHL